MASHFRIRRDGSHYAASNGYGCDKVGNCAKFPEFIGVPIPEPSGNLKLYMPELQDWAQADGPQDFRKKGSSK